MKEINTKQIIEEVKEEVKDFPKAEVSFSDIAAGNSAMKLLPYDEKMMKYMIQNLRCSANIPWYRGLEPGFTGLVKRCIRKTVTFLVGPIAEDQARYNGCLERTIQQLYSLILMQQERIDALEGKDKDASL